MRVLAVSAVLSLALLACSSKKEAPSTGSSEPPKGSATEPPKTGSDTGSGSAGSADGSGSDAGSAAGSGSDAGSAAAGSGSGSSADGGGSAADGKWEFDKLTHDEKIDFMKKKVVPTMKPLFQKFDAKEFANFGCKTCHGKDPQKAKYKMPSPDIDKLDFKALEAGKQEPETAKWMAEVVKPEMAKLLQMPEYSDKNPDGFGCLHCHTEKK